MQKVISTKKIPIKTWLDKMEEGATKQAINLNFDKEKRKLNELWYYPLHTRKTGFGRGLGIQGYFISDDVSE